MGEICAVVPGPVSAEVAATELEGMLREGRALAKIAKNVTVKVPLAWEGLRACGVTRRGASVQRHVVLFGGQRCLAAKAGAAFLAVHWATRCRCDHMDLVHSQHLLTTSPELKTQVLAASIRNVLHVRREPP